MNLTVKQLASHDMLKSATTVINNMTGKRNVKISPKTKAYLTAFFTGLPFFVGITYLGVYLAQRGVFLSFFSWMFLIALPFSPLLVICLYFMYKALIPVTGGMPAKGFRQWALAYAWGVSLLLYWALWALVFDVIIPSIDIESREIFLPLVVLIATQLILARSTRYQQFMKRLFQTSTTNISD